MFGFFIPTTITVIASILTCVEARIFTSNEEREENFKIQKRKFQLLLLMNLSYLICWSPYALLCITHTFISKTAVGPLLSMIPTVTVKLSVCINPILYIAYNPQFHGTFAQNSMHSMQRQKQKQRKSMKTRNSKMLNRHIHQKQYSEAYVRTRMEAVGIHNLKPLRSILKESVQYQIAELEDIDNKHNVVLV